MKVYGYQSFCCSEGKAEEEEGCDGIIIFVYGFTSSIMAPIEKNMHIAGDWERVERQMRVFHEAVEVVMWPLQESKLVGLLVKTREEVEWK